MQVGNLAVQLVESFKGFLFGWFLRPQDASDATRLLEGQDVGEGGKVFVVIC